MNEVLPNTAGAEYFSSQIAWNVDLGGQKNCHSRCGHQKRLTSKKVNSFKWYCLQCHLWDPSLVTSVLVFPTHINKVKLVLMSFEISPHFLTFEVCCDSKVTFLLMSLVLYSKGWNSTTNINIELFPYDDIFRSCKLTEVVNSNAISVIFQLKNLTNVL